TAITSPMLGIWPTFKITGHVLSHWACSALSCRASLYSRVFDSSSVGFVSEPAGPASASEWRRVRIWSSWLPRTQEAEYFRARSTTSRLFGPLLTRSPVKMRWSVEGLKEVILRSASTFRVFVSINQLKPFRIKATYVHPYTHAHPQ